MILAPRRLLCTCRHDNLTGKRILLPYGKNELSVAKDFAVLIGGPKGPPIHLYILKALHLLYIFNINAQNLEVSHERSMYTQPELAIKTIFNPYSRKWEGVIKFILKT